ncbi:unnamed protein product [Ilex paraguariensis]|uniref:Uncharacterized protein n=1 Tax=Ilex paraguariensis TaxID=185542 RepID=A0ABC8R975_9AQUA
MDTQKCLFVLGNMASVVASSGSSASYEDDTRKPLWRYVSRSETLRDGGGNNLWQCNFCNQTRKNPFTESKRVLLGIKQGKAHTLNQR